VIIMSGRLHWFGNVEQNWTEQRVMTKNEGSRQRGCPQKTWWDYIREDKKSGLSCEDAQDRDQSRLRMRVELANPGSHGKWPLKRCVWNAALPTVRMSS